MADRTLLLAFILLCTLPQRAISQDDTPKPVPIVTGAVGFLSNLQSGHQDFGPKFEPILLLPLGDRLLVEAEYSTELPVSRDDGKLGPAVYSHGFEYLQLDYTATPYITIVGGYFPSPFGIYKERMDPLWIRNFIQTPLLFSINDNSSNGVMVRGGFFVNPQVKINYAASYSAQVDNSQFSSVQQANNRISVFLPEQRFEFGASYGRIFEGRGFNLHGFDLSWRPTRVAVDLRGEGIWSGALGHGYWLEAAHRFSSAQSGFLRRSQLVARAEQFFPAPGAANLNADLPAKDTSRLTLGWNYWATDTVRASVAFGREWPSSPSSVVSLALVYLFAFPGERSR